MKDNEGFILPPDVTRLAGAAYLSDMPAEQFSDETILFLGTLSDRIRALSRAEASEELKNLGFWLRRSHLLQFKDIYGKDSCIGLGLTFHIAPSNVPLMFAYTCAIGLMAGNSCVVRLSERRTKECELLCSLIGEIVETPEFEGMKRRISLISYDKARSDITEHISRQCDARIIWGGDRTIEEIRKIPLKPSATELVFPDRTSMAVLDADAVIALEEEALCNLANRFYNDTYSMDQNACSSPKIVFWRESSENTGKQAAEKFWNAVAEASKRYALSEIKVSQKYGALWECIGLGAKFRHIKRWQNRLYVLEMEDIPTALTQYQLRFGAFLEYHMKNEDDWTRAVSEKTQTLTFFGIERESLRKKVVLYRLKNTHHIVPVGQALEMDLVWDGKCLIDQMSQTIH